MSDPLFTILMPVNRPPDLMPFAIDSILSQNCGDFELFIVGDGAPSETIEAANAVAASDQRARVFAFPKGERHGEAHRHTALQEARGRFVCQLADDDLWFPEHLEEMAYLLEDFEFGHLLHVHITTNDFPFIHLANLADPGIQAKMLAELFNFFGPSNAGYRLETYRRLPIGWSPAPADLYTDLAMWRKFLALPRIHAGTRFVFTSLHFANFDRLDWSMEQRRDEIARYSGIISSGQGRDRLIQSTLSEIVREYGARHDYILALEGRAAGLDAGPLAAQQEMEVLLSGKPVLECDLVSAAERTTAISEQLDAANEHNSQLAREKAAVQSSLEAAGERLAILSEQLIAAEEQNSGLVREKAAIQSTLTTALEHNRSLQKALAARESEVSALRRSLSWRITAPLRSAARFLAFRR